MTLDIGLSFEKEITVNETNIASRFEEGLPDVFSTPDMIQEMESASYRLLKGTLPENQTSVGTHVNVSHDKSLRVGQVVHVKAVVIDIDRKKVTFSVTATSDEDIVGRGTHSRFIIDKE